MTNERIKRERMGFMKFCRALGYYAQDHGMNYSIIHHGGRGHVLNSIEQQDLLRLFNTKLGKLLAL